jgi:hypothetical protein
MLGSSLFPVVCGMAHVLFMLFVFCFGYSGVTGNLFLIEKISQFLFLGMEDFLFSPLG